MLIIIQHIDFYNEILKSSTLLMKVHSTKAQFINILLLFDFKLEHNISFVISM